MRYISTFSGIEAATLAWEPLGWEPVAFSEVAEFPNAVLAHRFPDVPNLGDITRIDWSGYRGAVGLVVGGSPCQSFSIAGTRTGLDGASGLMWEYVRAIQDVRPRWCVWENVPGALSSYYGEDFRCLLRALDDLGYGLAWRVLDAQFFGVAQHRERVFLVGCFGDVERACEVLFEPEMLRWDNPTSREKRQELARATGRGAQGTGSECLNPRDGQSQRIYTPDSCAPTICAAEKRSGNVPNVFKWSAGSKAGSMPVAGPEDASCTLDTTRGSAVGYTTNQRGEIRRYGGDGQSMGAIPASRSGKQMQFIGSAYELRRLTPRECERLQGMPDDWTRVPYRGKPAEECPDTPRYQAIGNSMAVPVMRWIGERIQEVGA